MEGVGLLPRKARALWVSPGVHGCDREPDQDYVCTNDPGDECEYPPGPLPSGKPFPATANPAIKARATAAAETRTPRRHSPGVVFHSHHHTFLIWLAFWLDLL